MLGIFQGTGCKTFGEMLELMSVREVMIWAAESEIREEKSKTPKSTPPKPKEVTIASDGR